MCLYKSIQFRASRHVVEQHGQGISPLHDLCLHKIHPDNSRRHTSMPQEKFQPKIPVFEQDKKVHDL